MTDRLLQGKSTLITGGARRLGRATALAMARAGADVAITFLHSAREAQHTVIDLSSFGVRAVALRCDITDEKSVKAAIKETGANSPKAMGAVIKAAKSRLEGKTVDGKALSDKVRTRLQ